MSALELEDDIILESTTVLSNFVINFQLFSARPDLIEDLVKQVHRQLPALRNHYLRNSSLESATDNRAENSGPNLNSPRGETDVTHNQPDVYLLQTSETQAAQEPILDENWPEHFQKVVTTSKHLALDSVRTTPDDDATKPQVLQCAGILHLLWFKCLGGLGDLNTSIECYSQGVSLVPAGDAQRPALLNNLSTALMIRFERLGEESSLNNAIQHSAEAVETISNEAPERASMMNNLGMLYRTRFDHLGELADIERALAVKKQALLLAPEGQPIRFTLLKNIGLSYQSRYERAGSIEDLDLSLDNLHQAAARVPDADPIKAVVLHDLGVLHRFRFERLADPRDLSAAIESGGMAVVSLKGRSPILPQWLNDLGLSYCRRFLSTHDFEDSELACGCLTQAAMIVPIEEPNRPVILSNLGYLHMLRYNHSKNAQEIDMAVKCNSSAALSVPDEWSRALFILNNLSAALTLKYTHSGELDDLDKAIHWSLRAISLSPPGHAAEASWMFNLGNIHNTRYQKSKNISDIHNSIDCFKQASVFTKALPSIRFTAARAWARISWEHRLSSTIDAYKQAMSLLPQVVWLGDTSAQRYEILASLDNVAMEAAVVAVEMREYGLALEWLEEGRCLVWNQLLQLRTPLEELALINNSLSERLCQIGTELEKASSQDPLSGFQPGQVDIQQSAHKHHLLVEEWSRLSEEARSTLRGREILLSKKMSSLAPAARFGSVVMVVVHYDGCYALVIRQNSLQVECLALTGLSRDMVVESRSRLSRLLRHHGRNGRTITSRPKADNTLETVLKLLWDTIVKPVLDFLGYLVPASQLPHIIWCPTGPLSGLPLHAAGDYGQPDSLLYDYAVSSYTPTLSTLVSKIDQPAVAYQSVLAVGQVDTPSLGSLPGVSVELEKIQELVGDARFVRLDNNAATVAAVQDALDVHPWVHFACHASQDPVAPSNSAFQLYDGPLSLATISEKQLKGAGLAFLSACETATGHKELADEAVHLAASMLMVGYRTVIATMWAIRDQDAPLVAEKFYGYMLHNGQKDPYIAARALHHAVSALRSQVGPNEFERWVPFIHFGI
ncbi:CHAT domain protein [Ceratobasidium sp. AG-Ba]|nr:CHAT domain protein [Ceratobasidium sp. AG-Ba]